MRAWRLNIWVLVVLLLAGRQETNAQESVNDTIRLGAVTEHGQVYPMVLLDEVVKTGLMMGQDARHKRNKLRTDVYVVYPYALTAAVLFKNINDSLDKLDGRRASKHYLKAMNRQVDALFKEPLKNLSVDQGHVLVKLINRQTGENCYTLIKELKGGLSAVMWQSVGIVFNNNLAKDYDPEGKDQELEGIVRELEASYHYRYQLIQQQEMLKKITRK